MKPWQSRTITGLAIGLVASAALSTRHSPSGAQAPARDLAGRCTIEALGAIAGGLAPKVTVGAVTNSFPIPGGAHYVAAKGKLPGYCQVTGNYVTNPATGKTANFIATFPDNWNGKYLQLGCSGSCGVLIMNNPTLPQISITAQGYPGQLLEKGYATFGNDLGHVTAMGSPAISSDWLTRNDGSLDSEALEDYLYRADLVLADLGKAFTRAFYASRPPIARSYFLGCSQGGREAMVAAARFPEKFDGIVAGSPAIELPGLMFQPAGRAAIAQRPGFSKITPDLLRLFEDRVMAQCDGLDGVRDGLIQNPAACSIRATRDAPVCKLGEDSPGCFTQAQAESLSSFVTAATDGTGRVLLPGYSVTETSLDFRIAGPGRPDAGIRAYAPGYFAGDRDLVSFGSGGAGAIDAFRVTGDGAAFDHIRQVVRKGSVEAGDFGRLTRGRTKLLWYHNLSDEALTPFMSINLYKQLAARNGGYARLQRNARLFTLPGTGHCSMSGIGPGNFDAMGTLESWVERGKAPDSIFARKLDPKFNNLLAGKVDWSVPPLRSMPLCPFPQMARYKGSGDVNDAANWECRKDDTRMLEIGESGRLAGVVR